MLTVPSNTTSMQNSASSPATDRVFDVDLAEDGLCVTAFGPGTAKVWRLAETQAASRAVRRKGRSPARRVGARVLRDAAGALFAVAGADGF